MTFPTLRNHFRGIPRKIYNFRRNRPRNLREQICNRREQVVRAGCKLLRANCESKYQHCGGRLQSCAEKNIRFDCNTSAIKDSIVDGVNTNTLAMIPTDNLTGSYPFTFEPKRPLYCPVSTGIISDMKIYVTDSLGRPVELNGIDWYMTLLLHSR